MKVDDTTARNLAGCGKNSLHDAKLPQRLKAALIWRELRHEWNSCPSRNRSESEFFRSVLGLNRKRWALALIFLAAAGVAFAQTPGKAPTVTMASVPLTTAQRAQATMVNLNFRVPPGYHINSNTPKSEFLIPTALKMDLPTDIILGKIQYPAGEDASFPFSPDEKLSVYSGDFTIAVAVHPMKSVVPGKYVIHGVLRYQACDNAACYPPKTLPVSLEVKVVKEPAAHRANPAQSPHVHN